MIKYTKNLKVGRKMKKTVAMLLMVCMAVLLCPTYSSALNIADKTAKISKIPTFSVDVVNGGTLTNADILGKTAVFMFGKMDEYRSCLNTVNLCSELGKKLSGGSSVDFYAVDVTGSSKATVEGFINQYDPNGYITACYGSGVNSLLSRVCSAVGIKGVFYLPLVVFVNSEGYIEYFKTGCSYECLKDTLYEMVGFEIKSDSLVLKVKGTQDYAKAEEALTYINIERARHNKEPLTMDASLVEAAEQRAAENAFYYSHTRPDGSDFSTAVPEKYKSLCGENILWANSAGIDAENAVNAWMLSPGHRENILTDEYRSTGIACFCCEGNYYWLQIFSKEESAEVGSGVTGEKTYTVLASEEHVLPELDFVPPENFNIGDTASYSILSLNKGLEERGYSGIFVKHDYSEISVSGEKNAVTVADDGTVTALAEGRTTLEFTIMRENGEKLIMSALVTVGNPPDDPNEPDDPIELTETVQKLIEFFKSLRKLLDRLLSIYKKLPT